MPTVAEAAQYGAQLAAALRAGLRSIDQNQTVSFQPYVRSTLPLDGFVFWLNANIVSAAALTAAGLTSAAAVEANGSLHFRTQGEIHEDETIAVHKMVFTAEQPILALAEITSRVLYIATWTTPNGQHSFKFSFSGRNSFYQQADLSHYVGDAVYPVFQTQLIDSVADFDQRQVVSNSLPLWLAMMSNVPFPSPITVEFPIFPAFLIPDNQQAPYIGVQIPPESTKLLQSAPFLDSQGSHWQLCQERVKFILYGLRNGDVLDFQDYLLRYIDGQVLVGSNGQMVAPVGVVVPPWVRDEHRTQQELSAMAIGKTVEIEVSYYQTYARQIAEQMIKSIAPTYSLSDHIIPNPPNQ
ncbi:MAG: hypothetical protein KGL39_47895 [Patescibacteria group bacterium]|nr:hypothetical protein [Patescibacteria group bacterium]